MNTALVNLYRKYRSNGTYTAEAAYNSARSRLGWMARVEMNNEDRARRSKASKNGWEKRRSQQ